MHATSMDLGAACTNLWWGNLGPLQVIVASNTNMKSQRENLEFFENKVFVGLT